MFFTILLIFSPAKVYWRLAEPLSALSVRGCCVIALAWGGRIGRNEQAEFQTKVSKILNSKSTFLWREINAFEVLRLEYSRLIWQWPTLSLMEWSDPRRLEVRSSPPGPGPLAPPPPPHRQLASSHFLASTKHRNILHHHQPVAQFHF